MTRSETGRKGGCGERRGGDRASGTLKAGRRRVEDGLFAFIGVEIAGWRGALSC